MGKTIEEKAIETLNEIIDAGWLISDMEKCTAIDACEFAIDSIRKCQRIAKAIDKVEEYICDVETDTVKAQGMAQALDIFEQVLGEVEDGNDN